MIYRPSGETMRIEARTGSADDTRACAAALAPALGPGDVLLLVGDLGAGKTTFVQGLAAGLGVTEQVTSPTFTLVRPYPCTTRTEGTPAGTERANGHAVRTMFHADLYRVEGTHEVTDLALGEMVEDGAVAVVEWGDVGAPVLGLGAIVVRIDEPKAAIGGAGVAGQPEADAGIRVITVELPPERAALVPELRVRMARWAHRAEA